MQPTAQPPAPPLLVALHHAHHNKVFASPGKDCPDASYRNAELDALGLADHISTGFAWVACHLGPHPSTGEVGWRNEDAYERSNLAVLDIDGDLTLDGFWAIRFAREHCLFTATSCSHNPAGEHRFRAVFQFIPTADTVGLHRHIVLALEDALGFTPKDTAGRKPERLWYGNDRAEIRFGAGKILPAELIFDAQDAWNGEQQQERDRAAEQKPITDLDLKQAVWLLASGAGLRRSGKGEYESYWTKVCAAAACSGSDAVWNAFMLWHKGGYHDWSGNTLRKVERERWKFRKSGIGGLFGLAADQFGRHWRDILPPELKAPRRVIEPPNTLIRAAAPTAEESIELPAPAPPAPTPQAAVHPEADPNAPKILVSAAVPDSLSMDDIRRFAAHEHRPTTEADVGDADAMEDLVERIFLLTCHNLHKREGGTDQIDSPEEAERLIRFYKNQLLSYQLYARNPGELERNLLDRFRRAAGHRPRRTTAIQPLVIGERLRPAGPILIPGLMEAGRTYLLYGKAGTGKTTIALMIARAVIGTPGYRKFLDYEEIPAEAWRQRRVLMIASDGGDGARSNLAAYSRWHNMLGAEWQQHYLTTITSSAEDGSPVWKMGLQHLIRLIGLLDEAQAQGRPYNLIIFDSLKAICPSEMKVGDQVISEYIETIASICAQRQAAQLYIHHQSRDSNDPQGVTALSEITDGNFQLKRDENNLHSFNVAKSRAQWDAHRETPYTIANGEIRAGMGGASNQQVDAETFLLRTIQDHLEEHRNRTSILPAESDARVYRGLKPSEIFDYMQEKNLRHSELGSEATVKRKTMAMIENGRLAWTNGTRQSRGLIPYGIDPRIINSDQTELDAFTGYIEDPEEDDVP